MIDWLIFLICYCALLFHFVGYVLCLKFLNWRTPHSTKSKEPQQNKYFSITMIVCTLDEEEFIEQKLENSFNLDYPANKFNLIISDGGSSDATIARAKCWHAANSRENLTILSEKTNGKVNGKIDQLNRALTSIPNNHLVLVSDCDAFVHTQRALYLVSRYFFSRTDAAVLGAWVVLDTQHSLLADRLYWERQNQMRLLESYSSGASSVAGPFFVFKRDLIELFPEDCVADDVYVPLRAHALRRHSSYSPEIIVKELRCPESDIQFFTHKLRKANAYCVELFRFLDHLPGFLPKLRFIFLVKLFQLFFLPIAGLIFLIESLYLYLDGNRFLVLGSHIFFIVLLLLTSKFIFPPDAQTDSNISQAPYEGSFLRKLSATAYQFVILQTVLIFNILMLIFWRRRPTYKKITRVRYPQ